MAERRDSTRCIPPNAQPLTEAERDRSARMLARTLYRELRSNGFTHRQIIAVAEELLDRARIDADAPT